MDPEVLTEAKDFVTAWIDKSGADGNGVNMEVRSHKLLNFPVFRWLARASKTQWTANSVPTGT